MHRFCLSFDVFCTKISSEVLVVVSAGSKNFERGAEDNLSARPHLSQMHTTIYRPFTRKKAASWKKIEPIWGTALTAPSPTL